MLNQMGEAVNGNYQNHEIFEDGHKETINNILEKIKKMEKDNAEQMMRMKKNNMEMEKRIRNIDDGGRNRNKSG